MVSTKNIKQHNFFQNVLILRNIYWAANEHIRVISEDHVTLETGLIAEKAALHHSNKLHFKIYWK